MGIPIISRRSFLCCFATSCTLAFLPTCSNRAQEGNYYVRNKKKILSELRPLYASLRQELEGKYSAEFADTIMKETQAGYEQLLPALSDIGGDGNILTPNYYQGAMALVFYQVMKDHGETVDEVGEALYRACEDWLRYNPMNSMSGGMSKGDTAQDGRRRSAERSQQREYPDDWVFEYIPGDGRSFEWGMDYTECGIQKLYLAHGAVELTPYVCLLDFPMSQALKTGLERTTTLALGGEYCDFRFTGSKQVKMEWTPSFLMTDEEEQGG